MAQLELFRSTDLLLISTVTQRVLRVILLERAAMPAGFNEKMAVWNLSNSVFKLDSHSKFHKTAMF